ncbi:hypothetical protein O7626_37085 [Micromonospora sp. WMMD1102]|uniref:hypothetical protein n=1 Tax=Micromonospora sp. WMMD1102 TaxID=3016105 RepID=UPI002414D579|nr:hypothetical protein [Micromonospora sp. WMMD1102]MDG4791446.1 hypothetical protein [Micromonospora sp. WMMD1102]
MTDRTAYLELIRELVNGDAEAYRERCAELDEKGWDELGIVVGAAFFLAARQRRVTFQDEAAIIRYVAETRAEMADTSFDLDPAVAEKLFAATTTGDTDELDNVDPNLIIESEMLLLWKLLRPLSADELSRFLAEVDSLSAQWAEGE